MTVISASDSRFLYEGRIDQSDASMPWLSWQGIRVRLDFEGETLALRFGAASGESFFDVSIDDGPPQVVAGKPGAVVRMDVRQSPGTDRHRLLIFKRTEAAVGRIQFAGVELAAGAKAFAPAAPAYPLRMEFFGDSITVGACNEDPASDQWVDFRTHNNARSYGALTAAEFRADYRCVAVSGMGIVTGYVEVKAAEVWNRVNSSPSAPLADLSAWQPDVLFVNFGENDDSFTRVRQQPFPENFGEGYVQLVRAIRVAYPRAQIVLLRGGMWGGACSELLREAWNAAVTELEAGDDRVAHFVFTHWSENHPRVSDAKTMADELVAWLKQQSFMARFQ